MKLELIFYDAEERELYLTTTAVGMRFFSTNLDDIEANVKTAALNQLTQIFARGRQIKARMEARSGVKDAFTNVDIKALDQEAAAKDSQEGLKQVLSGRDRVEQMRAERQARRAAMIAQASAPIPEPVEAAPEVVAEPAVEAKQE